MGAVLVDVEMEDPGDPGQLAGAGARDDLVVQRLRPVVHRPELLQRKGALLLTEATAHGLDDVAELFEAGQHRHRRRPASGL